MRIALRTASDGQTYFDVRRFVNGRQREYKDQDRSPHGSLPYKNSDGSVNAGPGSLFELRGAWYKPDGTKAEAALRCRIASYYSPGSGDPGGGGGGGSSW